MNDLWEHKKERADSSKQLSSIYLTLNYIKD